CPARVVAVNLPEGSVVVRFAGANVGIGRRRDDRAPRRGPPVVVRVDGTGSPSMGARVGRLVELGEGEALLATRDAVAVGDTLRLTLHHIQTPPLRLRARALAVEPGPYGAIAQVVFTDVADSERPALRDALAARSRVASGARRRSALIPVDRLPAIVNVLRLSGAPARSFPAHVTAFGPSRLRFVAAERVAEGQRAQLSVELEPGQTIRALALIVRDDRSEATTRATAETCQARILQLSEGDRQRLARHLFLRLLNLRPDERGQPGRRAA
ncbi:MAG: hypothetical protein NZ518_11455, partial [Dehalococcoidia bacterium]|nr:hypothetical protein [Dehalococcoidia bacterium]